MSGDDTPRPAIGTWLDPQLPLGEAQALCAPCPDAVLRVEVGGAVIGG